MVALRLGEQYEKTGQVRKAAEFYDEAYRRFPMQYWKQVAKGKYDNMMSRTEFGLNQDASLLCVVSCTKDKIWDIDDSISDYVPAKDAYIGCTMKKWLKDERSKRNYWIILSAKYGFIEPSHPIGNYNITFTLEATGPISDESLKNQVMYQERLGFDLKNFKKVIVIGNEVYYNKVKDAFSDTNASVERDNI